MPHQHWKLSFTKYNFKMNKNLRIRIRNKTTTIEFK